jgi:hypothetical protein
MTERMPKRIPLFSTLVDFNKPRNQRKLRSRYIRQANARFSAFAEEDAEEARRLYTAHKLTMYARVALPDGVTPTKAQIAAAGQAQQKIASKKVGEVAVTYSSGASSSSVSTDLADMTETDFGMQLLGLIKMYARSVYVP